MKSLPEVSSAYVKKHATIIEKGYYSVDDYEINSVLNKLKNNEALSQTDYLDIWAAFFEKIYRELPESAFVEAVKIKKYYKNDQQRAKEMIRLYRQFRR